MLCVKYFVIYKMFNRVDGGGLVVELKKSYILKTMKNKLEANIAQSKMQSEKMLKTMQQLSADAVYAGAFEMSLDEINAEIEAVRNGL